jgi:prophage antirepressor-like protein
MVLQHRQASGLFSFLEYIAPPGGDLNLASGDYTMNHVNTSALVKSLSFEEHPLHVFLFNGKIAFLTKEVGEILDISSPTQSLRQSKTLESGVDYDTISTLLLGEVNNLFTSIGNHASILYLSGFFLFVLRSNKPIAILFTRWAIQEAIPMALAKRQTPELTPEDLKQMELAAKHEGLFPGSC